MPQEGGKVEDIDQNNIESVDVTKDEEAKKRFCPKFTAIIGYMPAATVGGMQLMLYGMISAVGIRNMVESPVDFKRVLDFRYV